MNASLRGPLDQPVRPRDAGTALPVAKASGTIALILLCTIAWADASTKASKDDVVVMFNATELARARRAADRLSYRMDEAWLETLVVHPGGPTLTLLKPEGELSAVVTPIELHVAWQAAAGTRVRLDALEVRYRDASSGALISGTEALRACRSWLARSRCRLDESGLWVGRADFPAGQFTVYVYIADQAGRGSLTQFDLEIVPK